MSEERRGPWLADDWAWMIAELEASGDTTSFVPAMWPGVPPEETARATALWPSLALIEGEK